MRTHKQHVFVESLGQVSSLHDDNDDGTTDTIDKDTGNIFIENIKYDIDREPQKISAS